MSNWSKDEIPLEYFISGKSDFIIFFIAVIVRAILMSIIGVATIVTYNITILWGRICFLITSHQIRK
jgi:hypothetical protein